MKNIIVLISSFLFLSLVSIRKVETETIYWSNDKKLAWEDFKGIPDPKIPYAALTNGGFGYRWKPKGDSCTIVISTYFNKQKSWVKSGSETGRLLKHEQTHFDIIELFARMFRKEILEKKFKKQTFNSEITKLFKLCNTKKKNCQTTYDNETEHSIITTKQNEWDKKIQEDLMSYQTYADSIIVIGFAK